MALYNIGILCIQETHRANSDYWLTESGYFIMLSGGPGIDREWAGVGIIVAPHLRSALLGFTQASDRYMGAKFRCSGGKLCIISAYAPHAGRPFDERLAFFENIGGF